MTTPPLDAHQRVEREHGRALLRGDHVVQVRLPDRHLGREDQRPDGEQRPARPRRLRSARARARIAALATSPRSARVVRFAEQLPDPRRERTRRRSARRRRSRPRARRCCRPSGCPTARAGTAAARRRCRCRRRTRTARRASSSAPAGSAGRSRPTRRRPSRVAERCADGSGVKPRSCISRDGDDEHREQHADAHQERHAEVRHLGDHAAEHRAAEHRGAGDHLPAAEHGSRRRRSSRECSASTSQASTAPEKNVNPSPSSIETIAHGQNGASSPRAASRGRSSRRA